MNKQIEIIKSQSDTLEYKYIVLPNKMKCMLMRDKETQKGSASMSVGVGSLDDLYEAQGIAHLVEHMLFMGIYIYFLYF
jgi:insulysin